MKIRLLLAALLAASTVDLRAARAQDVRPGDDEVGLKNGGMVRGTVVDLAPGNQVTVLVDATGERKMIPWAEVAQVERGKHAGAAPPGKVAGLVKLRLVADAPALKLFLVHAGDDELVCAQPCDKEVDGRDGQEFYLGGDGVVRSDTFKLLARRGDIEMRARAGSQSTRTLGIIGSVAGYVVGVTGLGLLGASLVPNGTDRNGNTVPLNDDQRRGLRIAGSITLLGGAALALGSLYALSQNRTTFEVRDSGSR